MLTISIILFAIAAVIGVTIILKLLQNKETFKPAVFSHGAFAAVALILLIIYAINSGNSPITSIALFVIAAIGGFILFARDLSKKPGPKGLAVIHAGAAVIAFVLLLVFAFSL